MQINCITNKSTYAGILYTVYDITVKKKTKKLNNITTYTDFEVLLHNQTYFTGRKLLIPRQFVGLGSVLVYVVCSVVLA